MKKKMVLCLLALYLPISGCPNYNYAFKVFSYPPGSKPHESDWEYFGKVVHYSKEKGPLTNKSKKYVEIVIYDREKNKLLEDKYTFQCASIEATIAWEEFEDLQISLFERGSKHAEDDYNKELLKKGPVLLIELKYKFNEATKKFERVTN